MDIATIAEPRSMGFTANPAAWSGTYGLHATETVTVYKFQLPDRGFRKNIPFYYYATKAAIAKLHGTLILGTDMEVRVSDLDAEGIYEPAQKDLQ